MVELLEINQLLPVISNIIAIGKSCKSINVIISKFAFKRDAIASKVQVIAMNINLCVYFQFKSKFCVLLSNTNILK